MVIYLKSDVPVTQTQGLPQVALTAQERAVAAIASLTGWYEAEYQYCRAIQLADPVSAFAWWPKKGKYPLRPLQNSRPPIVTGSHGKGAMQLGYASDGKTAATNGKLGTSISAPLMGVGVGTLMAVARTPSSSESGNAPGGVFAGAYGPNGYDPPKMSIDGPAGGNTGNAIVLGGGNYAADTSQDYRNGTWHVWTMLLDGPAGTLKLRKDGAQVAQHPSITSPNPATPGIRSVVVGGGYDSAAVSAFNAFVGQISALMVFNTVLGSGDLATAEGYLKSAYGIA